MSTDSTSADTVSAPAYIELHAHSSHSLLDGVPFPADLAAQAAACGMPALALTDHDGLYGAVPFIRAAEAVGIKPILGAEMTLTDLTHLVLLAETTQGYANLSHLITLAHRDQPKGIGRLDPAWLAEHSEGLIALSGCREGVVTRPLLAGKRDQALAAARHYAGIFGRERFFIELPRSSGTGPASEPARRCHGQRSLSDARAAGDPRCTFLYPVAHDAGSSRRPSAGQR